MSTWHQDRNRVTLYSETQWTAVTDPPNRYLSLIRFDTYKEAKEHIDRIEQLSTSEDFEEQLIAKYTYLLPPQPRLQ